MRFTCAVIVAAFCLSATAKNAPKVDFEPPFWWSGMNETSLQIMVYGEGIRDAATEIDAASGARIDSIVRLDSPNYQLVYLNTASVKPGTSVNFKFKIGKTTVKATYAMRERDGKPHPTFDASDVLYLIMPDRFADGGFHIVISRQAVHKYAPVRGIIHNILAHLCANLKILLCTSFICRFLTILSRTIFAERTFVKSYL